MKKLIAVFAILFLTLSIGVAAPAPMPKPLRDLNKWDITGSWKYKYGLSEGEFHFFADGHFRNNLGTTKFAGTWTVENNSVIMMESLVWERQCGGIEYGNPTKYTFKFSQTRVKKGKIGKLEGPAFTGDSDTSTCRASLER